jgi:erythronate-4-phosphate dehydrogenase
LEKAFIGTPHIAGYSADGKANGTAVCVREFCRFFGLDILAGWYPKTLPEPSMSTIISIDCTGKTEQQVLYEAVAHTYPIWDDSQRLKQSPAAFEEQRENYWIRREFGSFTVHLDHPTEKIIHTLDLLGFIQLFH